MIFQLLLATYLLIFYQNSFASDELSIPVAADFQRYVQFLAYPAPLLLTIENSGWQKPGYKFEYKNIATAKIKSESASSLIRTLAIQSKNVNDKFAEYNVEVEANIMGITKTYSLAALVDFSKISEGIAVIKVPSIQLIPAPVTGFVRRAIAEQFGPSVQRKILDYLDKNSGLKSISPHEGAYQILLVDAVNRKKNSGDTGPIFLPGQAEPISQQILIILALVFWFILIPIIVFLLGFSKIRKNRFGE